MLRMAVRFNLFVILLLVLCHTSCEKITLETKFDKTLTEKDISYRKFDQTLAEKNTSYRKFEKTEKLAKPALI